MDRPLVTSTTDPSPKLNDALDIVPSGSFPVAVNDVESGADPVAGVAVSPVQIGEALAATVGLGEAVGDGAVVTVGVISAPDKMVSERGVAFASTFSPGPSLVAMDST